MFLLIKLTALFFILAINTLSVSAEDVSKNSEETFKDKVEVLPSPIKDTINAKVLNALNINTELKNFSFLDGKNIITDEIKIKELDILFKKITK